MARQAENRNANSSFGKKTWKKGVCFKDLSADGRPLLMDLNTLRTGAFKLFKCTFSGSKQFKSTIIMCFFKYL